MCTVYFKNEEKTVSVLSGATVLEAIKSAQINIAASCNGMGICKGCAVNVEINNERKRVMACKEKIETDITVITVKNNDEIAITVLKEADAAEFYAALDIGTTTLEMSIISNGDIICNIKSINPQTEFASDVMGRIEFAKENTKALKKAITDRINKMLDLAKSSIGIGDLYINKMVCSSNTVMAYLLRAENPKGLGTYPYSVDIEFNLEIPGEYLGIKNCKTLYFPPVISAFVGADAVLGALYGKVTDEDNTLFIDIGTNAEMMMYKDNTLYAASVAAGPAFEGMNISCGMNAKDGAIDSFVIKDNTIKITTIGKKDAIGICGSGIMDIISELLREGIIDKFGTFKDEKDINSPLAVKIFKNDNETAFLICKGVYITQSDIRNFQLAKAAVRAGIEMMCKDADKLIIAGSFGEHINPNSLIGAGVIKEQLADKISFIGNSSLKGAIMLIQDKENIKKLSGIVNNAGKTELSGNAEFEKLFIESINF